MAYVLVDVKSASSFSFKSLRDGLTRDTDSFGYLTQLGLYNHALKQRGFRETTRCLHVR